MKKLILTLTAIIAFGFITKAQNVNIPDANFKAALVANLSINTNGDTEIQVAEANSYPGALNVSQLNIVDLTGVEEFTNIFNLNCGQNPLTSVDVSNNIALTSLTINFTQVGTLDVSNLVNLTFIEVSNNYLTSLDLSNNLNLTNIRANDNSLNSFNVKNGNNSNVTLFRAQNNNGNLCIEVDNVAYSNTNWTNIDATSSFSNNCSPCIINIPDANFKAYLVGNAAINTNGNSEVECSEASTFSGAINCINLSISDLTGIEAFTTLQHLNCSDNSLTSLDVSQNTSLTYLNFGANSISNIDVSQNTVLEYLTCYSNTITNLDLSQNTALYNLNCNTNSLTSLDVSQNLSLTSINCHTNSISSIDVSQNTSLTYLWFPLNSLTSLNVANGNNANVNNFGAHLNPNLTCIQVDNASYSTTNWTNIDTTASFSSNCGGVAPILVSSITVQGQGGVSTITTNGGTLQMEATVLPLNADDASYTWSVVNSSAASISSSGLLTALANGNVDVLATANDGSGVIGAKTITISNQSVGINDFAFENVTVFPNPTNGIVNLEIEEELSSIKLFDLTGKVIKTFNPENTQLDVSDLTTGIYFLEIANAEKKSVIKLIKK